MKKLNLLFIAVMMLFLTLPASAQHHIGILGGLNLANMNVEPEEGVDYSNRAALGLGGVLDFRLADKLALCLEPMYLQKGAKAAEGPDKRTVRLSYVEVPAMLKLALGNSSTQPYLMAGPTLGFLLTAKVSDEATGEEEDIRDEHKGLDFGIAFGAGVSFPVSKNSLFVEGRYALGLSNIVDIEGSDDKAKNKGIQIMAGISFPLGGK